MGGRLELLSVNFQGIASRKPYSDDQTQRESLLRALCAFKHDVRGDPENPYTMRFDSAPDHDHQRQAIDRAEEEFIRRIATDPDAIRPAQEILRWARSEEGVTVAGGEGPSHATLELRVETGDARGTVGLARLREDAVTAPYLELLFGRADDLDALADTQMRTELERMFAGQPIAKIAPRVPLSHLADTDTMSAILGMLQRLALRPSAWRTDTPALESAQTSLVTFIRDVDPDRPEA